MRFPRVLVVFGVLAGCTGGPDGAPVPATVAGLDGGQVRFHDEAVLARAGAPRFTWAVPAAVPTEALAGASRPAVAAARWHVAHEGLGMDAAALATLEVTHVHDTGRGAIVVRMQQRVAGLDVWRSGLRVVMDRDLRLVAVSGSVAPVPATRTRPVFALDAAAAVDRAIRDIQPARTMARPAAVGRRAGYVLFSDAALAEPAHARAVLFPSANGLVPGYLAESRIRDGAAVHAVRHVVAADDGRVLYRASFADDAAHTYRVWADATPPYRPADGPLADSSPHPAGAPNGLDPGFVLPADVTLDGFNTAPHGAPSDPWLPAGSVDSRGNNVDAYADLDFTDGFSGGDLRAATTAPGQFLRTYDTVANPNASPGQIMAAVTQLFYVNNWLHDWWYDSGFDEAAGNAQADNFGRGGAGADVLLAEGQDSSGTNNANMSTPADGFSPRMQMYVFDAPPGTNVMRDGTIDNQIIAHEWGHYWHHRLVDCGGAQCGGMSEGFGDFQAMMMTVREGDDLDGAYAMSYYVTKAFTAQFAYFGIRRYPYSLDFGKNALTFRHIRNGEPLPVGVPRSDLFGGDNYEVHNMGEVWCAALWEALAAMLQDPRFTFEEARRQFADYLVAGMLATPPEPTFTEQRDAILAAAAASSQQDFVLLAQAFARRGLGSGAVSPPLGSFDGSGVQESFEVTGTLGLAGVTIEENPTSCDGDGILDIGEDGTVEVTLRNTGAADLAGATMTLTSTTPGVAFPSGNTASFSAPLAPFATTTASVAVRMNESSTTPHTMTLHVVLHDPSAALATTSGDATVDVQLDVTAAASATDDVESPSPVWTADHWQRIDSADAGSHTWLGVDAPSTTDATLVSPPLLVGNGAFGVTFRHRFQFEESPGTYWDGAVMEVSSDGGASWQDAAQFTTTGYNGTISAAGGNPLAGRPAWVGASVGYPGYAARTVSFGTAFAGDTVLVRFRVGTDAGVGGFGLELDDLVFAGITNTPFPDTTVETGDCLPGERPIAAAGPDQPVTSNDAVTLDGSGSNDPDGGAVTYVWTQVSGIHVTLAGTTTVAPTFTAPIVSVGRAVKFRLIVTDSDGRVSLPDDVTVLISPLEGGPPDAGVPDAGVPDAGAIDAGEEPPPPDAAESPDAGEPPVDGGDSGCGCSGGGSPAGAGLVLLVGLLALRRRGA